MATSFTSYWGNALMGIQVKWDNVASATSNAVDATTKFDATIDLKLYAAGTTPQAGTGFLEDSNQIKFWLLILNP